MVVVAHGSCPTAAAVEDALAVLLPPDARDDREWAAVVDRKDGYAVTVLGNERLYTDPQRDCAERARVSAIFIALTLRPPVVANVSVAWHALARARGVEPRPSALETDCSPRSTLV